MSDALITSLIALSGVLLSIFASYLVARFEAKNEIEKIKKELEKVYVSELFKRRIDAYTKVYALLSNTLKEIELGKGSKELLENFIGNLNELDSHSALLFSDPTARVSGKFRQLSLIHI